MVDSALHTALLVAVGLGLFLVLLVGQVRTGSQQGSKGRITEES